MSDHVWNLDQHGAMFAVIAIMAVLGAVVAWSPDGRWLIAGTHHRAVFVNSGGWPTKELTGSFPGTFGDAFSTPF